MRSSIFGSYTKWKRPVLKGLNSGASLTPCGNENNSIPVPSEVLNAQFSQSSPKRQCTFDQ
jgi:hypothetical protein